MPKKLRYITQENLDDLPDLSTLPPVNNQNADPLQLYLYFYVF
jgi:hypothetical protein